MSGLNPAEVSAIKREIQESLHCALPGLVEAFDSQKGTVSVRPALRMRDGELPLLKDVPVFRVPGMEIQPGDKCLVIFADADTDAFLETGEVSACRSARRHSLSDGFAFVGFSGTGISGQ